MGTSEAVSAPSLAWSGATGEKKVKRGEMRGNCPESGRGGIGGGAGPRPTGALMSPNVSSFTSSSSSSAPKSWRGGPEGIPPEWVDHGKVVGGKRSQNATKSGGEAVECSSEEVHPRISHNKKKGQNRCQLHKKSALMVQVSNLWHYKNPPPRAIKSVSPRVPGGPLSKGTTGHGHGDSHESFHNTGPLWGDMQTF